MADEETTDLTEGGDSGAAKKQKAPKAPKEVKVDPSPTDKKQKGKKEKGGAGGIIIIMLLVLILLVGGFAAILYFNMFKAREITSDWVKEPLLDVIIWLDPSFSSINNRLAAEREAQEKRFEEREADLNTRESDLIARENALNALEQTLDRKSFDLDRREDQIIAMYERTIPIHKRDMTEQELEDMLSLSRTFSQMSPEDAASILVELYDPRDVAAIIYYMGERNAASILAAMNVDYAAEITEILLYS